MAHLITRFLAGAAALGALALPAQAAIRFGDSSEAGVKAGNTPELMLVIWDPVKEVSYTRDLGIATYAESYSKGDTSKNLFVYGQQDRGYQKLFDPTYLNGDTNFQTFLSRSTNASNQYWGIFAAGANPDIPAGAGDYSAYMTLNHPSATGVLDPEYTKLLNWPHSNFANAFGTFGTYLERLNIGNSSSTLHGQPDPLNTHGCAICKIDYSINGSSFNVKGDLQYAGTVLFSTDRKFAAEPQSSPQVLTPVGKSSWFYYLSTNGDGAESVVVKEFDNLAHDAYWGLGVDSKGNYILSYTLDPALTPTVSAAGALLRLRTDYAASYGQARLISAPNDLALSAAVTAVPEPATWGLMGLGLAVLGLRARRRA